MMRKEVRSETVNFIDCEKGDLGRIPRRFF